MTMETFSIVIQEKSFQYTCNLDEDADVIAEQLLKPVSPAYTPDYIGIRAVTVAQIQRAQLRLARQRINELLESQERTIKYFKDRSPSPSPSPHQTSLEVNHDENSSRKTWRDVLSPPQSLQINVAQIENSETKQLFPEQNNSNRHHDLLTFPLSEVVENRIVTAIFECYRENRDQLDIPVSEEQLTLEWFYSAIAEVAQRNYNDGSSVCNKRVALDDYLELILVPSAHELGLLPFSIIALDNTLMQMGDKPSHFRDIFSRFSEQIHEWFITHTNYESLSSSSSSSSSLKNSNDRVQRKGMLNSPPSSAKKEKQRQLFSSLSHDINMSNDKIDGNSCLYFAPMHSPTKLTTRAVFVKESTEELKERARWSSRPSPSRDSQEMKKYGKELQRDDQRRGKLTQQSVLPVNRSPTKCSSPIINNHSPASSSSSPDIRRKLLHNGHDDKQKHKHKHNHINDDITKEMDLVAFIHFLESGNVIPNLIDRREAVNIFVEMVSWNRHHPDLIYSVLDSSVSSISTAIDTDTISYATMSIGDPDVALTLPERGFTLTLAVIATYCYSHILLGEVRLEKLLKVLSSAER